MLASTPGRKALIKYRCVRGGVTERLCPVFTACPSRAVPWTRVQASQTRSHLAPGWRGSAAAPQPPRQAGHLHAFHHQHRSPGLRCTSVSPLWRQRRLQVCGPLSDSLPLRSSRWGGGRRSQIPQWENRFGAFLPPPCPSRGCGLGICQGPPGHLGPGFSRRVSPAFRETHQGIARWIRERLMGVQSLALGFYWLSDLEKLTSRLWPGSPHLPPGAEMEAAG